MINWLYNKLKLRHQKPKGELPPTAAMNAATAKVNRFGPNPMDAAPRLMPRRRDDDDYTRHTGANPLYNQSFDYTPAHSSCSSHDSGGFSSSCDSGSSGSSD